MNYVRESTIAISASTKWKLARIVAASQPTGLENKQTVDSLADSILEEWILVNHPALDVLWNERERINDRAHKAINEKGKTE
jgi:hypothetical protein